MYRPLDSIRLVTCAGPCGQDLLPPSEVDFAAALHPRDRRQLPAKLMAARVNDRPYCDQCRKAVEGRAAA